MVSKGALAKMNYSELLELRKRVDDAIEHRYSQERQELTKSLSGIAKLMGVDVRTAAPKPAAKSAPKSAQAKRRSSLKGKKVKPKYQNPQNREQTWTGRGRQPLWLAHEIAAGKKIESFLIQ